MSKQHIISRDNPPITDSMTDGSAGTDMHDLVGRYVVTSYAIPDSDRRETLLLLDNGRVICLSCDPGIADDDVTRTPDKWECCLYDATHTPAGYAMRKLTPGQWL